MTEIPSVLDQILAGVREDVEARRSQVSLDEIKRRAAASPTPRDAHAALAQPGVSVIAEVKRKSPSKGDLATIADPAGRAARGGSAC
jgi:indole-3-glycerol phosphate synthase